jgi:hypothetical protein
MPRKNIKSKKKVSSSRIRCGLGDRKKEDFETPPDLKEAIVERFGEYFDPCPLHGRELAKNDSSKDGLLIDWKEVNFINPPYNEIKKWLKKGVEELHKGKLSIFLVPVRSNTNYWKELVVPYAAEILFIHRQMKFIEGSLGLPVPMCLIVYSPSYTPTKERFIELKNGYLVWTL